MEVQKKQISYAVWLALIRLTTFCTLACYGLYGVVLKRFSPGWEGAAVAVVALLSCAGYVGLSHRTIYVPGNTLLSALQRRPRWRGWLFALYVPYLLYNLWFGLWMTWAGAPLALIFPAAAAALFAAAYRALCAAP